MPQLSLYLDKETMKMVEKRAKISKMSLSKWVSIQLKESANSKWPQGYFENFGALSEKEFPEIGKVMFTDDVKRESF